MKKQINQFGTLETFLMNDQPFTCPKCGSRFEELSSFFHTNAKKGIQVCLNEECKFTCYEEEDKYYLKLWEVI